MSVDTLENVNNKKESVKTMNRKEAVIYLMQNQEDVLKCLSGNYYVWLNNGFIVCGDTIRSEATAESFQITVPNDQCEDECEFEIVRELRKMCFGEAFYNIDRLEYNWASMVSIESGKDFTRSNKLIDENEFKGLWTVEGVYE